MPNGRGKDLRDADLRDADLERGSLFRADLTGAVLTGADLSDADLSDAELFGIRSGRIKGTPINLPNHWRLQKGHLIGPGASLIRANLNNADLTDADLTDTVLRLAHLDGADLTDADLTGAEHNKIRSGGITGTPKNLPNNWTLRNGRLLWRSGGSRRDAKLRRVDLTGADHLTDADLIDANLRGARSFRANLQDTDLGGANLKMMMLDGVDLRNADLTGAQNLG